MIYGASVMSDYLVSKLEENQLDSVEDKEFEVLQTAEAYAHKSSLEDISHLYSVKIKIDDNEYETLKIYKHGSIVTKFV
jgi:hypothetical protein